MKNSVLSKNVSIFTSPRSEIRFEVHYPEKNPSEAITDITNACSYIGLFDGIDLS